jgi:phosphatidylglycerol lysyltransferase
MGDPIGPPDVRRELAWRFREMADEHGGRASFYEVAASDLPIYLDLGLRCARSARKRACRSPTSRSKGRQRSKLRQARTGCCATAVHFEVLPKDAVERVLDELAAISDHWLAHKNTREKRFSLGRFDRDIPVAHADRRDPPRRSASVRVRETSGPARIARSCRST